MARAGYCGKECLDAADHGYRFLREKMCGSPARRFPSAGRCERVTQRQRPNEHLYGQSFALYAISEYAPLATGRRDVRDFAIEFFHLLEAKSHDAEFGGYREHLLPDWTPGGREGSSH
jgi:mannobiose 2-epimerase